MKFVIVKNKSIDECDGYVADAPAVPAEQPSVIGGPDRWDNILGVGFQTPSKTLRIKRKRKKHGK